MSIGDIHLVTVFKNIKDTDQPFHRPSTEIFDRIRAGESRDLIEAIRSETDKDFRNELKKGLPSICFSGQFRKRLDSEITEHSGLICLDFDGYEEQELLKAKAKMIQDKYSHAVFISPSGKGLKVIVKIPRIIESHRAYFSSLEQYYNLPANFDKTSINVSRVCYESYDPDIYVNLDSATWTDLSQKEYKEVIRHKNIDSIPITDENKIVDILCRWWEKEFPMTEGVRNHNAYVLASAFNDFGINKNLAELVLERYQSKSFNASEIRTTINSAYSKVENFNTKCYEDEDRLNNIRSEMRAGKMDKSGVKTLLSAMSVSPDSIDRIADRIETEVSGHKFWMKDKKGNVSLNHISFKRFLEDNGFFKFIPEGAKNYVFVRVTSNLIDHTTPDQVKTFVLDYVLALNDDKVYNFFAEKTKYFKEDFLTFLNVVNIHFVSDTKDLAYLYFKNVAVMISASLVQTVSYIDLGGYVWREQLIDRDFTVTDDFDCDFKTFLSNVSFSDKHRILSMESTVGYLLHSYKPAGNSPAVIFNDEKISDNPEGGTGKGLIIQSISQLKKVVVMDGKDVDFNKSFTYQLASPDTQVLVFDDVKNGFPFERLFSVITEGITLEKKNKDAFRVPHDKSPKIAITTNYAIRGVGNSFVRRKWELELHQFYSEDKTPDKEFGRYLFRDWNESEYVKFDNYMISCLQRYLKSGLIKSEFVNLRVRKLSAETCHDFIEWCGLTGSQPTSQHFVNLLQGQKVYKSDLYSDFIEDNPDFAPKSKFTVSRNKFGKWIIAFCIFKGQANPREDRDSQGRWIKLETKHIHEVQADMIAELDGD